MLPAGMHRIRVLFADQFGFARGKYVPAAAVTGEVAVIMRIVVVFPAPFGPSTPKHSPSRMSNEMSSTATKSP